MKVLEASSSGSTRVNVFAAIANEQDYESLLGWRHGQSVRRGRGSKVQSIVEAKDYEAKDHELFNWNRYYVDLDFTKKIDHYDEPGLAKKKGDYGSEDQSEAKDYVDYMPME